jgi:dTDP-4-dehydrorhamnose reductase
VADQIDWINIVKVVIYSLIWGGWVEAMSVVRALVTGNTGRLGPYVVQALDAHHEPVGRRVFTMSRRAVAASSHFQIDITDRKALIACLRRLAPTHIIHLAALTSPARAHVEPDLAWRTNVEAIETLAYYSKQSGAKLTFASTDFVFRGDLGRPYTETDQPDPQTIYGRTKLAAEALIADCDGLITRLALIHSTQNGSDLSRFAQRRGATRSTGDYYAVADEFRSPLLPLDAASAIVALSLTDVRGVFHLGGHEVVSAYELAKREIEAAGLDFDVHPISRTDLPPPGRPKNAALDASKFNQLCRERGWAAITALLQIVGAGDE